MLKEETKTFLRLLYHDDRNSNYFLCNKVNSIMHSQRVTIEEMCAPQADIPRQDCYISINGFTGWHRRREECRQISSVYFDLDCHGQNQVTTEWVKGRTLLLLEDAIDEGQLFRPTMLVDSGCGLHLYFVLQDSVSLRLKDGAANIRGIWQHHRIRQILLDQLLAVLKDQPDMLEYDAHSADLSRVMRVPGTFNTRAGKDCSLLNATETFYSFSDFPMSEEKSEPKPPKKKTRSSAPSATVIHPEVTKILSDKLQEKRMEEMEKLLKYRHYAVEGKRYCFAFLYYNAATQLYGKEHAKKLLEAFCSRFQSSPNGEPFLACERAAIANCVDRHDGHYTLTKAWIIENLEITQEEISVLHLFEWGMHQSRIQKQWEYRQQKNWRNAVILELAEQGRRHSDIAIDLHVSLRTVQNVLKSGEKTRAYQMCKKSHT